MRISESQTNTIRGLNQFQFEIRVTKRGKKHKLGQKLGTYRQWKWGTNSQSRGSAGVNASSRRMNGEEGRELRNGVRFCEVEPWSVEEGLKDE